MSKKVDDAALDALLDELDASSDEEENEEAAAAVMGRSIEATASEANTNELVKKMEEEMMALLLDDADHDEKEQKPFHRGNGVDRDENDGGMSTKAGEKGEHSASRNSNEKDTNAADQGLDNNNNNNNVNVNDQMENAISNLLNGLSSGDSTLPNDMPDMAGISEMGEDIMEQMMNEFVSTIGKKDDFDGMIDGMMKQMLSKELMYEPMKNVCEKFPAWLANAKKTLPEEEYIRYGKQYQYFQRIVALYETDENNFSRLQELMTDLQEYGQPPAEIIKELAPGLDFDDEGLAKMPDMPSGMFTGGTNGDDVPPECPTM